MKMLYTTTPAPVNVGKLLSEPSDGEAAFFTRDTVKYEDHSERFKLKDRQFQRQYAHIYAERLLSFRPKLIQTAENKWGKQFKLLCFVFILFYRSLYFDICLCLRYRNINITLQNTKRVVLMSKINSIKIV